MVSRMVLRMVQNGPPKPPIMDPWIGMVWTDLQNAYQDDQDLEDQELLVFRPGPAGPDQPGSIIHSNRPYDQLVTKMVFGIALQEGPKWTYLWSIFDRSWNMEADQMIQCPYMTVELMPRSMRPFRTANSSVLDTSRNTIFRRSKLDGPEQATEDSTDEYCVLDHVHEELDSMVLEDVI